MNLGRRVERRPRTTNDIDSSCSYKFNRSFIYYLFYTQPAVCRFGFFALQYSKSNLCFIIGLCQSVAAAAAAAAARTEGAAAGRRDGPSSGGTRGGASRRSRSWRRPCTRAGRSARRATHRYRGAGSTRTRTSSRRRVPSRRTGPSRSPRRCSRRRDCSFRQATAVAYFVCRCLFNCLC